MGSFKNTIIIVLLVSGLISPIAQAKSPSQLLQQGLYAEEMEGDLDAAIKIYEQIIARKSVDDRTASQAMYRLGMCYLKKQNEPKAKAMFEELITRFSGQTTIINKVKPLLEEMSNHDPAVLMPPETLAYLEIGSPGQQIETILRMLQGTPFANPIAAIGGNGQSGQKSPGDIMGALLNPSMMAEFKKMRGLAIGVVGIQNEPPLIAVLFPGKSDALRGILLAGLGMAGTAGEPIKQMQTLVLGDNSIVAYDDTVFIITQDSEPLKRLNWCINQYKGITNNPTLASENKSFAKVSRKSRQDNAITIWIDGHNTYKALADKAKGWSEFQIANSIADFNGINDIIAQLSINPNNIGVEASVNFKDGHHSLLYDLVRTPNLSRTGFDAVPSQAFAVASLALGESESTYSDTAQKSIKRLTGLDVGREIFANIEQITFFVLSPNINPEKGILAKQVSPVLLRSGLIVTSNNPQQTKQILDRIFAVANMVVDSENMQSNQQANVVDGRYVVAKINNESVYCYMTQTGKTTILALSPEVIDSCLATVKNKKSILAAGPLQNPLRQLSPETSKLVMINAGGAIRNIDSHIHRLIGTKRDPDNYPFSKLLMQLAQDCSKTSIQFRTDENPDNFVLQLSVDQLPPLGRVLPILMQIDSSMPNNLTLMAIKPGPANKVILNPNNKVKLWWLPGINAVKHQVYFGTKKEDLPLLAEVVKPAFAELPKLEENTTYYWRIDEVSPDGTITPGNIWMFKTGKQIGWWKLDEASGDTVADSSDYGTDGKIYNINAGLGPNGSVWYSDPDRGTVLSFNGDNHTGAYVRAGKIPALALRSGFTWAFWAKQDSAQSINSPGDGDVIIIGNRFGGKKKPLQFIRFTPTRFEYYNRRREAINYDDIPADIWIHHVVVKKEGKLIYYRNGKKAGKGRIRSSINANPFYLGGSEVGSYDGHKSGERWRGLLDDVRIYNYALSPAEVKAIYNDTRVDSIPKIDVEKSNVKKTQKKGAGEEKP
ncbi:MAG: LamG-like jellyroll fold domain-containing protein [Planctomycetota bacterium]|jgi:tetratricopeptide (TPR) repeat protein